MTRAGDVADIRRRPPAKVTLIGASLDEISRDLYDHPQLAHQEHHASVYRAVSVFQAGDLLPDAGVPAGPPERRAVFDGVVRYGEDLALVIEFKLAGNVDQRQAREITIGETAWRVALACTRSAAVPP